MTMFWILAAVLLVISVAWLVPALLGKGRKTNLDRQQQNISIAKEKLAELKVERDSGVRSAEEYQQARAEIETTLLDDVGEADSPQTISKQFGKASILVIVLLVPAISIGLYNDLGNPAAMQQPTQQAAAQADPHQQGQTGTMNMAEAAARLAEKLASDPNNGDGWYLLGQTYMTMGRHAEAALAFSRSYEILGDNPNLMLRYADALAMSNKGRISGKPFELIKKALEISPDDITGLWLAGMGYAEQGDFKSALKHWRKLEPMLAGDPRSLGEVQNLIAHAEQSLGIPAGTSASQTNVADKKSINAQVKVKVSLHESLKNKAAQTDTVFVFARAVSGPPIPLAVTRTTVADLPIEVILTDAMAMSPQMKLSDFSKVSINARVSKSGNPIAQSGDFEGISQQVVVSNAGAVDIQIQKKLP